MAERRSLLDRLIEGSDKPLKDVDATARAHLVKALAWLLPACVAFFLGVTFVALSKGAGVAQALLLGLFLGLLGPLLVYAFLFRFVIGGTANYLGRLYGGGSSGSPTPPNYWRAQALSVRGSHREALEALEVEALADPGDPGPCLRAAALCVEELDDPESAVEWYKRARSAQRITTQTDAYVSIRLVDLYETRGEAGRAMVASRRQLERHPDSPYAQSARSRLNILKAELEELRHQEENG
jgi:tetratricopeptide (TPR) repeat protein